ncbi:hypothetical protein LX36DRAFT_136912 [Colletotrichum falcatum]|nr:hypothetical protein LX36DRAFT_136912 [Colletotrichum falcatum]
MAQLPRAAVARKGTSMSGRASRESQPGRRKAHHVSGKLQPTSCLARAGCEVAKPARMRRRLLPSCLCEAPMATEKISRAAAAAAAVGSLARARRGRGG